MHLRKLIPILLIGGLSLLSTIDASAQLPVKISDTKVKVNGSEYYQHKVRMGQTLFSIAKAYGVKIDDILDANPGAEEGIRRGTEILIPLRTVAQQQGELHDGYIRHTVKQRETIYGISRQYGISQEKLIEANPGIENGLKEGQVLRIPVDRATGPAIEIPVEGGDSLVPHTVAPKETLYSLSKQYGVSIDELIKANPALVDGLKAGQVIYIPVKGSTRSASGTLPGPAIEAPDLSECRIDNHEDLFHIILILPLKLSEVYFVDVESLPPSEIDPKDFKSLDYIQFYEGFMMAMDSLKNMGMNLRVDVFDTPADSSSINLLLKKPAFRQADLIIGPEDPKTMTQLSVFAAQNSIYLLNPWFNSDKYIQGLDHTINLVPQVGTQLKSVCSYLLDSVPNPNFIIVHDNLERDMWVSKQLEHSLAPLLMQRGYPDSSWTVINYPSQGLAAVQQALDPQKQNVILTAALNEAFISNYVNKLNNLTKNQSITLVGMPWWRNYRRIETPYLQNLNLHLFSRYFIDYEDPAVRQFILQYRERYETEPDPNEFMAFRGYDIGMYFVGGLYYFGKRPGYCFNNVPYRPMYTEFSLLRNEGSGFENQFINIYRIRDFQLENMSRLRMIPDPESMFEEPEGIDGVERE